MQEPSKTLTELEFTVEALKKHDLVDEITLVAIRAQFAAYTPMQVALACVAACCRVVTRRHSPSLEVGADPQRQRPC